MGRHAAWPPPIYTRNGKDRVRLRPAPGQTQDITLGTSGSPEAKRVYAWLVAELSLRQDKPASPASNEITLALLAVRHLDWASGRYDARQVSRIKTALSNATRCVPTW